MSSKVQNIVITGGGTGGHIYPGVAIAEVLKKNYPQVQVHFVGANGGLEEKIFPRIGFPYHLLPVGRLHSSVGRWQQIKTMLKMPWTLFCALRIFMKLSPVAVLGVGGFASGPFLFMGILLRSRTAFWEANAKPGMTNRWLSGWVDRGYVVFDAAKKYFSHQKKIKVVGLPVRKEFFTSIARSSHQSPRQSPHHKMRLLIFGGSQGARAINQLLVKTIKKHPNLLEIFDVVHQAGHRDYELLKKEYGTDLSKMVLLEYIHDMPEELKAADFVICRAGASTVAEVIACQKPALFIPLPTAADNHQYENAKVLFDQGGALLLEQSKATPEALYQLLLDISKEKEKQNQMIQVLKGYDFSNSAQTIVDDLLQGLNL